MTTKRVLAHLHTALVETTIGRAALILSAAMAATTPALAADMKGDYGSRTVGSYPAVPVPAPIPIPETFQWYVRGDAGYSLKSTGSLTTTGIPQVDLADPDSQRGLFSGSFAFGRYVTPSLRAEFGIDVRSQQTIGRPKNYTFTRQTAGQASIPDPVTGVGGLPTTDTNTYAADRQDNTSLASHTLMANLYYDVKTGGAFTPYIGAGAGLSIAQMKRRHSESATCTQSVNSDAVTDEFQNIVIDATGQRTRVCGGIIAQQYNSTEGQKGITAYGPALALMAGTAVQLTPGVSLDAGYRLMWQGSTPSISAGSVTGDISKLTQGARTDHELRMGLRWDIW